MSLGLLDDGNSTTTALSAGGEFIGSANESWEHSLISVSAFADAAGVIRIEYSQDGTNWDDSEEFTIDSSSHRQIDVLPKATHYRVCYFNGANAQSSFRLKTFLNKVRQPEVTKVREVDGPTKVAVGTTNTSLVQDVDVRAVLADIYEEMKMLRLHMKAITGLED